MSQRRTSPEGSLPSRAVRGLHRMSAATVQIPAIVIVAAAAPATVASTAASGTPSVVLCSGYGACASLGYASYDYANRGQASYWRMSAGDECTNYVAYVEATVFKAPTPLYLLGNAGQWPASAAAHGIRVNDVPSVGAVAEWDAGTYGIGAEGHVAVVEKVGPHDSYLLISQQHISSDVDGYDWTRINAGYPAQSWQSWPSHFIHFPTAADASVGYYNGRTASVSVSEPAGAPASLTFRLPARGMVPLAGNWTGHGTDSGYYDPKNGSFHLRTGLRSGKYRAGFTFGPPGMVPLTGDWTGRGVDRVGYYDPQDGSFHLRDYLSGGRVSAAFTFGPPGMIPLAGDWTGGRTDGVGYYNPRTARFVLRSRLSAGPATASFRFGPRGMIPLTGNWAGGRRSDSGYYNPRTGRFTLRAGLAAGRVLATFRFGPREMVPVAADWLG